MSAESTHANKKKYLFFIPVIGGIVILAILFNIFCGGKFLNAANINSICTNATIASFLAWGYCFVFALGYMDLSIGAAMVLCVYATGELGNRLGIPGVLIGGLVMGIILMLINFNIFAWSKIPSWIAGLGMLMVYEAGAALYTAILNEQAEVVVTLESEFRVMARAPWLYIVLVAGLVFAYIMYNLTTPGLNARAIGTNVDVAKSMGISIPKTLILVGIICGIFVGFAGIIKESYAGRVFAQTGLTSLNSIFQPLATVLLAQVIQKRINIIIAVPFCAIFVYACFNVLTILGVPSGTLQEFVLGATVLIIGMIAQHGVKGIVK